MHIILRQTLTEKEKTSLTQGIIIHAPAYTYYFFRKCNILQSLKVSKIRACRKTKSVTIIKIFTNTECCLFCIIQYINGRESLVYHLKLKFYILLYFMKLCLLHFCRIIFEGALAGLEHFRVIENPLRMV